MTVMIIKVGINRGWFESDPPRVCDLAEGCPSPPPSYWDIVAAPLSHLMRRIPSSPPCPPPPTSHAPTSADRARTAEWALWHQDQARA